jgi:hypothetical protein
VTTLAAFGTRETMSDTTSATRGIGAARLTASGVPVEAVFNNDIVGNTTGGDGAADAGSVRVFSAGPEDSMSRSSSDDWVFGVAAIGPDGLESLVRAYVAPVRRLSPVELVE